MASYSEPNPVMTIRANRLSGEMLELQLKHGDLAGMTVRDLKQRLAEADSDPSSPCCELQYILTSWMSLPEIRDALGDKVIPEGVWPNADERFEPGTLLANPQIFSECKGFEQGRPFALLDAWKDALLSRPIARVFAETPSMLRDMFAFGQQLQTSGGFQAEVEDLTPPQTAWIVQEGAQPIRCEEVRGPGPKYTSESWADRFREVAERVVAQVEPETVQRCFETPDPRTRTLLWESLGENGWTCESPWKSLGWEAADCFCELLTKKGLDPFFLGGSIPPHDDNLLQYLSYPIRQERFAPRDFVRDAARCELSIAVAKRLTLQELCSRNKLGMPALLTACDCVSCIRKDNEFDHEHEVAQARRKALEGWRRVRNVIKVCMLQEFKAATQPQQNQAVEILRACDPTLTTLHGELSPKSARHFFDVIDKFEEHLRSQRERCGGYGR